MQAGVKAGMSIPLVSVHLTLKSLNPSDLGPLEAVALVSAFTGFIGPNSPRDPRFQDYRRETNFADADPVDRADGKLSSPRRFAGDHTLGRGSYYSICYDSSGRDDGTLVRELAAYADPDVTPGMTIEEDVVHDPPSLRLSFQPRRNILLEHFNDTREVFLPLRVQTAEVSGVLDLRMPPIQEWFAATFGDPAFMQGAWEAGLDHPGPLVETEVHKHWRKATSFFEMLPVLMSPELGGSRTTQIIGLKLRQLGCKALLYPSARNAVGVTLTGDSVLDSRGWNLVRYDQSPDPQVQYKHYGADPWISQDGHLFHLSVEEHGPYRRTWLIKPPLSKHNLHMKLLYHDRLPVEALWPTPSDYPEIVPQDPISDEDLQLADANAMRHMRDEFQDRYSALGPDHPETIALENWLAENDTDWYTAFRQSENEKQAHSELAAQEDDIGRELHARFVREPHHREFDESAMRQLLGKLAIRMWRSSDQQLEVCSREQIETELHLDADLDSFLTIAEGMKLLSRVEEGAFRFTEQRLVNYFAVPGLIRYLESEYSDRGFIRDRAVKALENIGAIAVPALVEALGHEDGAVNLGAAVVLQNIGEPAVASVVAALHSNSAKIRRYAVEALSSQQNASAALPQLLHVSQDEDFMVKISAIHALGQSKNNLAIDGLVHSLADPNSMVRGLAEKALTELGTTEAREALEEYRSRTSSRGFPG
jgi:HEAT repeats/PBS lyase HEAT-like repeat